MKIDIEDLLQLKNFADNFASLVRPNLIVYLNGPLGAGKTTFMQYIINKLGYSGLVKSPTYSLVETYETSIGQLHHFDLYRLHSPMELYDIGINDYFSSTSCVFIEWPDKGLGVLGSADIVIDMKVKSESNRQLSCEAKSRAGDDIIKEIKHR